MTESAIQMDLSAMVVALAVTESPMATTADEQSAAPHPKAAEIASGKNEDHGGDGDDDEGGGRLIQNPPPKPRQPSQRKRTDWAAFGSWLDKHQDRLTAAAEKTAIHSSDQSTAVLFRSFEAQKIIESPRDYQIELFERAKQKNIIAVLDTGSGKTLIAAMLLRHIIAQELDDRAAGKEKRVSFFLADKVGLVRQQWAVLEANLDHPVVGYWGESVDWVDAAFWTNSIAENMIIVCTAAILHQGLTYSHVRMDQINLLIFDEAHHAKKKHPYAQIIKDFYSIADTKPKIFSMTASPVDAQVDVNKAARELEGLLQSEIATVADPAVLHQTVCKPKEEQMLFYERPSHPGESRLTQQLKMLVGRHSLFKNRFVFAGEALYELGPWCVDRFWKLVFKPEDMAKLEAQTTSKFSRVHRLNSEVDNYLEELREAADLVGHYALPGLEDRLLSDKVIQLRAVLMSRFKDLQSAGIVFVQQRFTAMMLADLFQQPEMAIPGFRSTTLVGGDGVDVGNASTHDQVKVINKLKTGQLNCVFATSVAEEGLDIPQCNLVVRFDLFKTMIQYIQSRGRARRDESLYVNMLEQGNLGHLRTISMTKAHEQTLREFCSALPEDRKLMGHNYNLEYFLRGERHKRKYVVPGTGATLTYQSSLVILANFVATLPHPPETTPSILYSVLLHPQGFVCEVLLPPGAPIRTVVSRPHSNKQSAKCAAAFDMCVALLECSYLTPHLRPAFAKQLPAMRNARLAISPKKKAQYGMRMKPEMWSSLGTPVMLYALLLRLSNPGAMDEGSRPLVFLTRQPVPGIAAFPLFFGKGRSSNVECVPIDNPMTPDNDCLGALVTFFLTMFEDVFSKIYEGSAADLPYFFAPAAKGHEWEYETPLDASSIIDWDLLRHLYNTHQIPYTGKETDSFFKDKYVTDPLDGSRKFLLRGVRRDLTPRSPVPEWVPDPRHRSWRSGGVPHDILNYSWSIWTGSRQRSGIELREDQPVVEAEVISLRRNLLDESSSDEPPGHKCFLILEPLVISKLPVDVVAMAYNVPAIIYRVEAALVALDACKMLRLPDIPPDLALEALTKDSDNSGDQNEAPINFQAGMGRNYERLELLGDSFLKLATTIAIYTLIPDKGEFEYHVERMCLICNKNLFNSALELGLEGYVRSREFTRRGWYPATVEPPSEGSTEKRAVGLVLKRGKKNDAREVHVLGDKSIADVCEALIGAAYLSTYPKSFDMAVRAVTTVVRNENHTMTSWADYFAAYKKPAWQLAAPTSVQLHLADKIADKMGYRFRDPRLLRCAFMHPSYPRSYEQLPSYQRLEFLGDALFDMVAVDFLFHRHPAADPQWLTEHKMAMVSNQFLGALAVSLGFHRHLVSFSGTVQGQVREWADTITAARTEAEDDAVAAGKTRADFARDYWVHVVQPPKALPDVLEAYLGAVFVDASYDYDVVRTFFARHVQPYFEDAAIYDTFANKHPVTLAGTLLRHRFGCRAARTVAQETPDHDGDGPVTFATQVAAGFLAHGYVLGHGVAASGRYAKLAAAKRALARLEGMAVDDFRRITGCDCEAENGLGDTEDGGAAAAAVAGTTV